LSHIFLTLNSKPKTYPLNPNPNNPKCVIPDPRIQGDVAAAREVYVHVADDVAPGLVSPKP